MKSWISVGIPELWGDTFFAAIPIESVKDGQANDEAQAWIAKLIGLTPVAAANDS